MNDFAFEVFNAGNSCLKWLLIVIVTGSHDNVLTAVLKILAVVLDFQSPSRSRTAPVEFVHEVFVIDFLVNVKMLGSILQVILDRMTFCNNLLRISQRVVGKLIQTHLFLCPRKPRKSERDLYRLAHVQGPSEFTYKITVTSNARILKEGPSSTKLF